MDSGKAVGQVFNVGNDEEITILDLAKRIVAETGSSSAVELVPFEQAYDANFEDLARRVPDLSKIRALVGYEPKVRVEEIIRRTVEWHRGSA